MQQAARRVPLTQAAAMSSRHVAAEAVAAEAVEAPVDTWAHVPEANRVADLETILQERDACGVSTPLGNP